MIPTNALKHRARRLLVPGGCLFFIVCVVNETEAMCDNRSAKHTTTNICLTKRANFQQAPNRVDLGPREDRPMKPKKGVNLPVTAPQGSATGLGDMNLVLSALLSGILLLPAALHAEAPALPKFNPTPVSDGPILVFRQPKRSSNELALYLFDPATHEKPQVIWQNRYHPNPRPLKRLTTREILIEYQHQLQLVDLPTAVVTPLLEGTEQNKLVATEGKTIYFLKRLLPETIKDMGISLTTGKEDKTVVEKYFRPRDVLFRYEVGTESGAKKVSPIVIEHLLDVNDDGFFVITADKPQKLARIGRDGSPK